MEDKTKWGKIRPLDKRTTDKTSKPKSQYVSHPDSDFYDLGLVPKIITSTTRSCIYTS
jgi:hypothetical protein